MTCFSPAWLPARCSTRASRWSTSARMACTIERVQPTEATMNQCYMCGAEAVSRCYTCGQLICDRHGSENCQRCDTGVVAGDPRPEHFSAMPLPAAEGKHGWWRPQPA